ncbi:Hypothetical predicted protein [Olea europaea subsp. europaea]|uniref:Uncharacterized protein n=1 Tax=Olea europaea subsp. europaea TaxID=158383 RepID=A0A8S0U5W6_OLEEU|nr:Hypothetical predicted protein [Olea europaea subsp. europaea]
MKATGGGTQPANPSQTEEGINPELWQACVGPLVNLSAAGDSSMDSESYMFGPYKIDSKEVFYYTENVSISGNVGLLVAARVLELLKILSREFLLLFPSPEEASLAPKVDELKFLASQLYYSNSEGLVSTGKLIEVPNKVSPNATVLLIVGRHIVVPLL